MQTQLLRLSYLASFIALTVACGSSKPETAAEAATNPVCETASIDDIRLAGFASSPNACSQEMFATYKDAGFQVVNGNIAKLALAAPTEKLGPSFQTKIAKATEARQTEFAAHLLSFLEAAYGSSVPYSGPSMVTSHADLAITLDQYKYFVTQVVVPALSQAGVSEAHINSCFAPVVTDANFVKTVVSCK